MPKILKLSAALLVLAGTVSVAGQAREDNVESVDIPAGDLAQALLLFSKRYHADLVYSPEQVRGLETRGVHGNLTTKQVVARLLAGTKLQFQSDSSGAILITPLQASYAPKGQEVRDSVNGSPEELRVAQSDQSPNPQSPKGESVGSASGAQLEEIIVTAQKRKENLQEVPVSAQVISGQALAQQNSNSLLDLAQTVPSLHITFGGQANDMYIRGIGSASNQAFEEAVGTFVDDIYHGRSRMSDATFLDLDRIEVLKGPQSTFFGNNAIAGALNIVTKKPGDQFDASGRLLYGQFGQYAAEGAIGGPITETLGIRLAVMRDGQSGWIDNVVTGQKAPDENNEVGRLTAAFRPSEDFDATFKIEGGRNRETGGFRLQVNGCPPPAPFTTAGVCSYALSNDLPVGLDNNRNADTAGQLIDLDTFEDVLTIDYRKWNQTLTSVSGFYNYEYDLHASSSGSPLFLATVALPEMYHQFSQELRVTSPSDQRIEYTAGAYFQTGGLRFNQGVNLPILNPMIESAPPFSPLVPYLPLGQSVDFAQTEHAYSLFGSATWNVTDRLKVIAGLRGSWDSKTYTQNIFAGTASQIYGGVVPLEPAVQPLLGALFGYQGNLSGRSPTEHAAMPSAKIQYQLNPAAMIYFSYARGFLAGGINGTLTTGVASQIQFQPEYVNAYEAGIKSKLLDDRLLLNVDVFRSDYTNLQVGTSEKNPDGAVVNLVQNAAASVSQGVELEAQWVVSSEFRLGANITYLDAYYTDFKNASAVTALQSFCATDYVLPYCSIYSNPVPATANLTGRPTEYAPLWSGSISAVYTTNLSRNYRFTAELSPYFSSGYFMTDAADEPLTRQGDYTRLDARLTLGSADGRWAVDLIGKNLTDADILVYGTSASFPNAPGTTLEAKEQPRNFALQFRYHL